MLFGAALLVLSPVLVSAQQATGQLSGTVRDQQGGVLPGAAVVAQHLPTGTVAETTTGGDGRFTLSVRPGGPFVVTVQMSGFALQERREVFVEAGEETGVDFELQLAPIGEVVTVIAGAALARDDKRSAPTIVDVVSADSVGRFPDANAAEALRRVPGVSLEIDQGEGRFVVVRGIDASLNNVTINGQIVGTPAEFGTRGVSMDSVPADLISRLEVIKAVKPDMDANAIGASINIDTLDAFELPTGFLFGSLRSGYNAMSGRAPFSGSANFGRTLGTEKRWGFVVGGSYSQRRYDTELFRASSDTWTQFNSYYVPQNQAYFLYDIERKRQGVNASLEFRPRTGQQLAFRFNHNLFQDTEGRQQTEFDFTRGTLTDQTPTSGRFSQGRATREYRDYRQRHLINAAMLAGTHDVAGSALEWNLGASRGQRKTPFRVDWEFRSAAGAFPNTYDVSDPTMAIVTPNEAFYSASSYPFRRVRFRDDLEREDVISGEANLQRPVTFGGRTGYWKAGAKIVNRDKMQDRTNDNYNATSPAFKLSDFGVGGTGPDDFFRGTFRFGPTLNLPGLKAFFRDNPQSFVRDDLTTQQNCLDQDFTASETVYAGYGMVSIDFSETNLMFGVRVESTQGEYFANELVFEDGTFTGRVNPASGTTDYTDVLPGVHLTFLPNRRVAVRVAWTNTLGRPAYADLAPIRVLDEIQETDGSYVASLSEGNSTLKPYEAMNFDVSLEYYLPSGLLAVAPFYKRITNPIYDRSTIEHDVVYNNRLYETFSIGRPENADNGHIVGVELNYQQTYTALPSPFDGIGANFNYTWTDSAVTVFERSDELPFFKQSEQVGNAAVLYTKYGIEAQLSMSFESPMLRAVGLAADSDNYGDWYNRADLKVSFPLVRFVRGVFEARNLNDAVRRRYAGISDRRVHEEIYGRDIFAGIDWRF
jgi:TonB-dependent receptor